MSTRKVVMTEAQFAPILETEVYATPENMIATIDKCVARNTDASNSHTLSVLLVPPAETPTGAEFIFEKKTLLPGQSWTFPAIVGNFLAEDGGIRLQASEAGVIMVRISGREDTVSG